MNDARELDPTQGPLAEFAALRAEIDRRSTLQHNTIALQITSAGAIFGFAVSAANRTTLLLILPITSYMLTARFVAYYYGITLIASYITTVLSRQIGGGLQWEDWRRDNLRKHEDRALTLVNPLFIIFPGVGTLALVVALVTAPSKDFENFSWFTIAGFIFAWSIGAVLTALAFRLVLQITKQYRTKVPSG